MFKPMRRDKKTMSMDRVDQLIQTAEYGVMCVLDPNGYPYGVPVNYVSDDENIYVHCAQEGWKLEALALCDKVSFTIVGRHSVVAEKFSSNFESVICYGRARMIEDETEKMSLLKAFIYKYSPDFVPKGMAYVEHDHMKTSMIAIKIEYKSGKTNIE